MTGGNAEVDLDGMQRVYNGQLDIGACEADWRGVYARDITRSSRFSVDSASPDVVERASGGVVRIPSGATLAAKWSGPRAGEYRLTVNVAAGGTLSITSNGTEVATVAGPVSGMTVKLASAAAEFPLEFACSGDSSYAEILNLCRDMGACMILR